MGSYIPEEYLDDVPQFHELDPNMSLKEIFEKDWMVHCKSLAGKIGLSTTLLRKHHDMYGPDRTGIVKIMGSWLVRLPVFKEYYNQFLREDLRYSIEELPPGIDSLKRLFSLEGVYRLKQIESLNLFPFPSHRIGAFLRAENEKASKTGQHVDTRKEFGIWKDVTEKCYLVEIPIFRKWFKGVWKDSFM